MTSSISRREALRVMGMAAAVAPRRSTAQPAPELWDSPNDIFRKIELEPSEIEVGGNEEFRIRITLGGGYPQTPTRLAISLPTRRVSRRTTSSS